MRGAERRKAPASSPPRLAGTRCALCGKRARLSALHRGVLISASGRAFAGYTGRQRAPRRRLVVASRAEPRRRPRLEDFQRPRFFPCNHIDLQEATSPPFVLDII